MIKRNSPAFFFLAALSALISGCSSHSVPLDNSLAHIEPKIEFLQSKYKICRENCPLRTPKELDDDETIQFQLRQFELLRASKNSGDASGVPASAEAIQPAVRSVSILFDFGMSKPNKSGLQELRSFALTNEKFPIELVGGTDDIGTKNYNKNLATKRANFVKAWLLSHGVSAPITIVTNEECCHPLPYNKESESLKLKRKVSIVLR